MGQLNNWSKRNLWIFIIMFLKPHGGAQELILKVEHTCNNDGKVFWWPKMKFPGKALLFHQFHFLKVQPREQLTCLEL